MQQFALFTCAYFEWANVTFNGSLQQTLSFPIKFQLILCRQPLQKVVFWKFKKFDFYVWRKPVCSRELLWVSLNKFKHIQHPKKHSCFQKIKFFKRQILRGFKQLLKFVANLKSQIFLCKKFQIFKFETLEVFY